MMRCVASFSRDGWIGEGHNQNFPSGLCCRCCWLHRKSRQWWINKWGRDERVKQLVLVSILGCARRLLHMSTLFCFWLLVKVPFLWQFFDHEPKLFYCQSLFFLRFGFVWAGLSPAADLEENPKKLTGVYFQLLPGFQKHFRTNEKFRFGPFVTAS